MTTDQILIILAIAVTVISSMIGIYVTLSNKIASFCVQNEHFKEALIQEKNDRKTEIMALLGEIKSDRMMFQSHTKENSQAMHDLSLAVEGLTVFLKEVLPDKKKRKTVALDE